MLSAQEISGSLRGAALLFRGRVDGLQALDRSTEGFWRSFLVIVLVLPINAVTLFAIAQAEPGAEFGSLFGEQLPVIAIDWVAFPLALALVAGPLGLSQGYASYIVARNWAAPIMAAVLALPFILRGAGWIPPAGGMVLSGIALILVVRYHYMIVRLALEVPFPKAAMLVGADIALTILIVALLT